MKALFYCYKLKNPGKSREAAPRWLAKIFYLKGGYAWPSGWQGIIRKMCETYVTIARGNNPEQAFWVAQTLGLNGREIQNKDGFLLFSVPEGARPMEFVFELLNNNSKLQSQSEMSGCVLLMQADPSAPDEHYFLSQKKNAYIFFGYEGGKEHA